MRIASNDPDNDAPASFDIYCIRKFLATLYTVKFTVSASNVTAITKRKKNGVCLSFFEPHLKLAYIYLLVTIWTQQEKWNERMPPIVLFE